MPPAYARLKPLSADSSALQVTLSRRAHELLEYARALDSHAVPTGDIAKLLERALESHVAQLERRRFAKTSRSGKRRGSDNPRCVAAHVKRAVVERDGGQCTFVAPTGHRCEARGRLEFDHVKPVADGGEATAANLRLRCRAHNQLEAERRFGPEFMRRKRERSPQPGEARSQTRTAAQAAPPPAEATAAEAAQLEVIPWLRRLGFSALEARRGAAKCADMAGEPLEHRVRIALRSLAPASARTFAP